MVNFGSVAGVRDPSGMAGRFSGLASSLNAGGIMMDEDIYRLMLLGIMAVVIPTALYFRIRSFTGEPLGRRDEGVRLMVTLRLCGLGMMLSTLTYLVSPARMGWSQVGLPGWLRSLGLPLGLVAAAWLVWMLRTLGPNLTDTVNARAGATLVTRGPYRWVRHPMYVGVALLVLAVSLITASAAIAVLGATVVVLLILRTSTEEAKLVERFGEAYRQYASRTGRFLPRFGVMHRA
jgi:protein-S-isoprenylcysteine O-methyltransferase Ste14